MPGSERRRSGGKNPTFSAVIGQARVDLWNSWERAANFVHSGIRGEEREEAVRSFLRTRLPGGFGVVQGEMTDYKDMRSTQLDVMIYDRTRNSPLLAESEQNLLPAEAVLAVVEVKSMMSHDELVKCFRAASQLRRLLPYKRQFIDARPAGRPAEDRRARCFFTVFAYETNLARGSWLDKEWERVQSAAEAIGCPSSNIDRIVVLNRGLINPARRTGKEGYADEADILQDWFLNLTNFLARETARRNPVDWQIYSRPSGAWRKL